MDSRPFAGKAEYYERYRVDYPSEAIETLVARAALTGSQVVADLGSGTGLLTRRLLPFAALVYAVEPDSEMRQAAEAALGREPNFHSVAGTAERTGLPAHSVDAITCGNSFHYFDPQAAAVEARRILRPNGRVVLLFHDTPDSPSAFMDDYLRFLSRKTPPGLSTVHSGADYVRRVSAFLGEGETLTGAGEQKERLTWDELRGRFMSSSIAPHRDDRAYESTLLELEAIFARHQQDGRVGYDLVWRCLSSIMA